MVSHIDGLRVEVAFATLPDDPAPAWQDVSAYVQAQRVIAITRGRQDEFGQVQPGTCQLSLDNRDGRFSMGNVASPYYPNVKVRRRVRVLWRDPAASANYLSADSATFETAVGTWAPILSGTITRSTVQAHSGAASGALTIVSGGAALAGATVAIPLIVDRVYTVSAWVFVPAGVTPGNVALKGRNTPVSVSPTVNNAWQRISATWTNADNSLTDLSVVVVGTPGQVIYIDDVQIDEGPGPVAFTTSPPAYRSRFTGYVDGWPTSWPTGGDEYSEVRVSATDRLKRLGNLQQLRSVIEQEMLGDAPVADFPLGESSGTTAGDISGAGLIGTLAAVQYGAGGTCTFGGGTGPGTDSLSALVLAPVDASNGIALRGTFATPPVSGVGGLTFECFVLTSSANGSILRLSQMMVPGVGTLDLSVAASKLCLTVVDALGAVSVGTSATNVATGTTRHVAVVFTSYSAVTVYMDGVAVITVLAPVVGWPYVLDDLTRLEVGGYAGRLLAGTFSHVAVYAAALSAARIAAHSTAGLNGFAGERSDQRIARYCRYAGVPVGEQNLDVGASTSIAHVDTTGQTPLTLMQVIADTENGVLFVDRDGDVAFHSRTRRYNVPSPAIGLTAIDVEPSFALAADDQRLVNEMTASRSGGITYRASSQSSIDDFGSARQTTQLATTSDNEVVDFANWRVQSGSTPQPRPPALAIDLLTNPSLRSNALDLDLSSMISVTGLPSQSPTADLSLFGEGYTESISHDTWTLQINTSPATSSRVWQLGVAGASELGTTTRLSY